MSLRLLTSLLCKVKGQLPEDEIASLPAEFSVESVEKLRVPQLDGERHLVVIKPNKI